MLIRVHIKVDQKGFGWTWSKMGVPSLVTGLWNWLYLKNELMEWTDILHAAANSGKLKVMLMIGNGRGVVYETLKSAVLKEWVYEFSWFFACWLWGSNF